MRLNMNDLMYTLSYALDCVEAELVGTLTGHGKRVAYISMVLGKKMQLTDEELSDLAVCAVLHDNALTQYIYEEYEQNKLEKVRLETNLGLHCRFGEDNLARFPFQTDMKDVILYHHERADGKGPFGQRSEETPVGARLIHIADVLDLKCGFGKEKQTELEEIYRFIEAATDTIFTGKQVELLKLCVNEEFLADMRGENIDRKLLEIVPPLYREYSWEQMLEVMNLFAVIVDYKSEFTKNHSLGIAKKAMEMGAYYGYTLEEQQRLYITGALHDIGKMAIHNRVLEKPDKLTDEEYSYMKNHAWYTWKILSQIDGFEDITKWASRHHEKLDGSGYPFRLQAEELDHRDRLLACLDIYQALIEPRPYKDGMPHEQAMKILRSMTEKGQLDAQITEDIDKLYGVCAKK